MRTYDIAHVKQGTVVGYPPKPLQDMTLEEIKKKYICAKANGDISVCSKCLTPCDYGKRAIQLAANEVYSDPPVPLYGGMTLIERARQENMLRRQQKEKKEENKEMKKSKDNRIYIENWYEKAQASGDPIKWIMEQYNIDRTKAMAKVCQWRNRHKTEEPKKVLLAEKPKEIPAGFESVETKIDSLMKQQDEYKQIILKYQKLYDEVSSKIDVLCRAMDIVNE